jgi:adenylate cyclase
MVPRTEENVKTAAGRSAWRRAVGLLVSLALGVLAAALHPHFDALERQTWDLRFLHRGTVSVPDNVVLIEIDEKSVTYEPWRNEPLVTWGAHYAAAVRHLTTAGVSAIGFDLIQRVSTEDLARSLGRELPWDQEFAQALAETGNTVMAIILEERGWVGPANQLLYANGIENVGAANFLEGRAVDPYAVVRGFKPDWQDEEGAQVPSLAVRLVEKHLGAVARREGQVLRIGEIRVPLHRDGTVLINYAGPPRTLPRFSFVDIAEGRMPRGFDFRGKIALIGESYAGMQDLHLTPFSRRAEANRQHMSGVEIWANAVSTLVNRRFLSTTEIPTGGLLLVCLALATGALFLGTSLLAGAGLCVLAMAAYYAASRWFFVRHDYLLLTFVPLCLMPTNYSLITAYRFFTEEREKRRIKSIWSRYLDPTLVEHLLENPETQGLGGTRAMVTVLFADVRGFTAMAEHMEPADVVRLLNDYFTAMSAVIHAHGGIVDKYVGDAIMAVWGVPFACPDGPERAARAAAEMLRALEDLNERWQSRSPAFLEGGSAGEGPARTDPGHAREGALQISIGIGINTGEAVFGNIGSPHKMDITVVGDAVNVASRLESLTKEYGLPILIGENTESAVRNLVATRYVETVSPRGREEPLRVYAIDPEAAGRGPEPPEAS